MYIRKQVDGTLTVPMRAEDQSTGTYGDGVITVVPGEPDYGKYLTDYEKEQARINNP